MKYKNKSMEGLEALRSSLEERIASNGEDSKQKQFELTPEQFASRQRYQANLKAELRAVVEAIQAKNRYNINTQNSLFNGKN